jgi:putative membrane protein
MFNSIEEETADEKDPAVCKPPDLGSDDRILLAWHRSQMANERTFLAWCRTSISLLAFGFVVDKFDLFLHQILYRLGQSTRQTPHHLTVYLSVFAFILGGVAIIFAGARFLQVRRHINRGEARFSTAPDIIVIFSVVVIVIMGVILSVSQLGPYLEALE